jgi:hypothetical protein
VIFLFVFLNPTLRTISVSTAPRRGTRAISPLAQHQQNGVPSCFWGLPTVVRDRPPLAKSNPEAPNRSIAPPRQADTSAMMAIDRPWCCNIRPGRGGCVTASYRLSPLMPVRFSQYSKNARCAIFGRGATRFESGGLVFESVGGLSSHSGMTRRGHCGGISQALLACMLMCQFSQKIEGKTSIGNHSPASAPPPPPSQSNFLRGGGGAGGWDVGALKRNADALLQKMASFDRPVGENYCNAPLPISPGNKGLPMKIRRNQDPLQFLAVSARVSRCVFSRLSLRAPH